MARRKAATPLTKQSFQCRTQDFHVKEWSVCVVWGAWCVCVCLVGLVALVGPMALMGLMVQMVVDGADGADGPGGATGADGGWWAPTGTQNRSRDRDVSARGWRPQVRQVQATPCQRPRSAHNTNIETGM